MKSSLFISFSFLFYDVWREKGAKQQPWFAPLGCSPVYARSPTPLSLFSATILSHLMSEGFCCAARSFWPAVTMFLFGPMHRAPVSCVRKELFLLHNPLLVSVLQPKSAVFLRPSCPPPCSAQLFRPVFRPFFASIPAVFTPIGPILDIQKSVAARICLYFYTFAHLYFHFSALLYLYPFIHLRVYTSTFSFIYIPKHPIKRINKYKHK